MTHIFEDFLKEDYEVQVLKVEKNTKKAVKEAIQKMQDIFKPHDLRVLVQVDATVVKGEDKIAPLVAFSLHRYRNFSNHSMQVVDVEFDPTMPTTTYSQQDYETFLKLKERGGNWESYLTVENVNWIAVNACIRQELQKKLHQLAEITVRYKNIIGKEKEEKVSLDWKRKWNFTRYSTSLLQFYKRCFDEISRILDPSLQYNPSPSFQRALVWSLEKKQAFIESIINEIPIGSFYVNVGKTYDPLNELGEGFGGLVWDGKQRLHALHSFILGEFDVEINGKRLTYFDNPAYFNCRFESCGITVFESRFDDLKDIIHAYVTINQAQVKHTDEDLKKAMDYLEAKSKERQHKEKERF